MVLHINHQGSMTSGFRQEDFYSFHLENIFKPV